MPIDILADCEGGLSYLFENVFLALDYVPRIRVLNLWATRDVLDKLVAKLVEPAPCLESLSLRNSSKSSILDLSPPLLHLQTPRLRRLEFCNCNFRWDSPMLRGLTHFQVFRMSPEARPSFPTLLAVLSLMPMLEILSLVEALPKPMNYDKSLPTIHLSQLSQLRLEGGVTDCSYMLEHLTFPPTVNLHLKCNAAGPQSHNSKILALIGARFGGNILQRVHIHCTAQEISILGWITLDFRFDSEEYFTQHMSICFHWEWDDNETDKIPTLMCATMNSLCLTKLWCLGVFVDQDRIKISNSTWAVLLTHTSTVQHLCIRDPAGGPFFALVQEGSNGNTLRVLLPSLRWLLIQDADFSHFATAESKCGLLLDWLERRRRMGAVIEDVQILSCGHITEETVELLSSSVANIYWDGIDRDMYSSDDTDDHTL